MRPCYVPKDMSPGRAEYETTGNEGTTAEHWYNKAVAVMWPRNPIARRVCENCEMAHGGGREVRLGVGTYAATRRRGGGKQSSTCDISSGRLREVPEELAVHRLPGLQPSRAEASAETAA